MISLKALLNMEQLIIELISILIKSIKYNLITIKTTFQQESSRRKLFMF